MNGEQSQASKLIYFIGILGSFLILAFVVWIMYGFTRPEPVNVTRAEERQRAAQEVRTAAREQLNTLGWVNQDQGIVQLPIEQAKDLVIKQWKDPAAARSNLLARLEKLQPPEPEPPPPSIFE